MKLLLAENIHLLIIINIIHDAQKYLAAQGIDQWQDGYPDESVIQKDIENKECYMVTNASRILGTAMFTTRPEPTYNVIEGQWLTSADAIYGVIHRMTVDANFRGLGIAKFIFAECEFKLKMQQIKSMRIDTHEDNHAMQALLKKSGYTYCGIIYLESGDKRLAFEKVL